MSQNLDFWREKTPKSLIRVTYFLQIRVGWILQMYQKFKVGFVKIYILDYDWTFNIVCLTYWLVPFLAKVEFKVGCEPPIKQFWLLQTNNDVT